MALHQREPLLLLLGDVAVFYLSLWVTLLLRYLELPSEALLGIHALPFTYLFFAWILVYFIAGLYDQHTVLFKRRLPATIFKVQLVNILLAALFFFLISYFGITPKTNLAIYLGVSFLLIVTWRLYVSRIIGVRKRQSALIIGAGREVDELVEEVNNNSRYNMRFVHRFAPENIVHSNDLESQIVSFIEQEDISIIVADPRDKNMEQLLPIFYNLMFLEQYFTFESTPRLYETIFSRIPISMLNYRWFLEHISTGRRLLYDLSHRTFDLAVSLLLGIPTLILFPFVAYAIRREDGGSIFIYQERVGQYNRPIRILKFRTMTGNDSGQDALRSTLRVTKVGKFLRQSRLDELPQLWNVLRGEFSLIGPRPELPALVAEYAEKIPYYNARHLIKPGLTGWAQIYHREHPHHGLDIEETQNKLSYDLYYVKNQSIALDLQIGLKTIRTLLSRSGA